MKKVIINADDFGMNKIINNEIKNLILRKRISSSTILVKIDDKTGSAEEIDESTIDDALRFAKHYEDKISFGIHINLNRYFRFEEFGLWSGRQEQQDAWTKIFNENREIILNDIEEQFEIFDKFNLRISHLDGHNHIHMLPDLFKDLVPIMNKHGVKKMRFPQNLYPENEKQETELKQILNENRIIYPDNFICGIPFNENEELINGVNEVMTHTFTFAADGTREYKKLINDRCFSDAEMISYNDFARS